VCNNKQRLSFLVYALAVLIFGLLEASCSTTTQMYSGSERPASDTALVRGADVSIEIIRCDGRKLNSRAAMLLPGEHTVEVTYSEGSGGYSLLGTIILRWKAEAGHTYIVDKAIHSASRPGMSTMFIIDQATGKNVSSGMIKPGTEEGRLRMIEASIEQFPQRAEFRIDKGYLLMKLKRYEEALATSETCISMNFNSAISWKLKSEALYELKRYDEAFDAITRAIQLRPNESEWYLEKDRIRQQKGTRDEKQELRAAYGQVASADSSRLTIQHFTSSFNIEEEYDANDLDISKIKAGDKVYIEYHDGKPRILKSISQHEVK
jgi:tetratricopeptide (TPR) repeat protein